MAGGDSMGKAAFDIGTAAAVGAGIDASMLKGMYQEKISKHAALRYEFEELKEKRGDPAKKEQIDRKLKILATSVHQGADMALGYEDGKIAPLWRGEEGSKTKWKKGGRKRTSWSEQYTRKEDESDISYLERALPEVDLAQERKSFLEDRPEYITRGATIGAIADFITGNLMSWGTKKGMSSQKLKSDGSVSIEGPNQVKSMAADLPMQALNFTMHESLWGNKVWTPDADMDFERNQFILNNALDSYTTRTVGTPEELETAGADKSVWTMLEEGSPELSARMDKREAATRGRNKWVLERLQKTDPEWKGKFRSGTSHNPGTENMEQAKLEGPTTPMGHWTGMEPFVHPTHPIFEGKLGPRRQSFGYVPNFDFDRAEAEEKLRQTAVQFRDLSTTGNYAQALIGKASIEHYGGENADEDFRFFENVVQMTDESKRGSGELSLEDKALYSRVLNHEAAHIIWPLIAGQETPTKGFTDSFINRGNNPETKRTPKENKDFVNHSLTLLSKLQPFHGRWGLPDALLSKRNITRR